MMKFILAIWFTYKPKIFGIEINRMVFNFITKLYIYKKYYRFQERDAIADVLAQSCDGVTLGLFKNFRKKNINNFFLINKIYVYQIDIQFYRMYCKINI